MADSHGEAGHSAKKKPTLYPPIFLTKALSTQSPIHQNNPIPTHPAITFALRLLRKHNRPPATPAPVSGKVRALVNRFEAGSSPASTAEEALRLRLRDISGASCVASLKDKMEATADGKDVAGSASNDGSKRTVAATLVPVGNRAPTTPISTGKGKQAEVMRPALVGGTTVDEIRDRTFDKLSHTPSSLGLGGRPSVTTSAIPTGVEYQGEENSLTLLNYKSYFNNRPLGRCLDDLGHLEKSVEKSAQKSTEKSAKKSAENEKKGPPVSMANPFKANKAIMSEKEKKEVRRQSRLIAMRALSSAASPVQQLENLMLELQALALESKGDDDEGDHGDNQTEETPVFFSQAAGQPQDGETTRDPAVVQAF